MKKDEIRNTTAKRKKASNQAEYDHRQHFQENTLTIRKDLILENQAIISLTEPNPRIDYSPFLHVESLT